MPIDASIYSFKPPQAADPMQTLGQVAVLQNQRLQREEAQQRIEINRAAESRLTETAKLDQQKRQEALAATRILNESMKASLDAEGHLDVPKLQQNLINSGQGSLFVELQKDLTAAQTSLAQLKESHGKDVTAKMDFIGAIASGATKYPADQRVGVALGGISWLVGEGVITDKEATHYIAKVANAPDQIDTFLEAQIAASPEQMRIRNAAPRPFQVGPEGGTIVDPTGTKTLLTVDPITGETGFEGYLAGPYARGLGKNYKNSKEAYADLTDKQVETARERYRLDQQTPVSIQIQQGLDQAWNEVPKDYRLTAGRAGLSLANPERKQLQKNIIDAYASGQEDQVPGIIINAAIESEPIAERAKILGRMNMRAGMTQIAKLMAEVPTNFIRGTIEETARAVGTSSNPKLARLNGLIMANLATYRQGVTGAAFSEAESEEYLKRFPRLTNDLKTNMAVAQGFLDNVNTIDKVYWEQKLGVDGAKLVKVLDPVDLLAPPATTRRPNPFRTAP